MQVVSREESGAFVETFSLSPTGDGPLSGLRFAVKDLIDVAGYRTGCGNPTWLATHPPAAVHALSVEQLLAAGATCVGKTVTDEVAFSLLGQNFFYGTPLNPAAPDRVPGGSSSGSASAVACGLVDFALGTDTGGSVRVPASNCGVWGWRPTHGVVSVAGVMPFSPTLDTVGILARNSDVLQRSAAVLIGDRGSMQRSADADGVYLLRDAFSLADPDVRDALELLIEPLRGAFGPRVRETSLEELCSEAPVGDLSTWLDTYRMLQGSEALSSLGGWLAETNPEFGPATQAGFEYIRGLDRTRIGEAVGRREHYFRLLRRALGRRDLVCVPTAPTVAPVKGSISYDRKGDYYRRALSLTAIAGVGRLPQVSMPLATVGSVPIGLSLIAAHGEDRFLLHVAHEIERLLGNAAGGMRSRDSG
jgi:amidase